ncbi:uncharacterized protein LOC108906525 [Anoplophora glabripennis]|uniref:uncharacterized protein LOC108906525 n=1 Tax=Anoplophora glabripennis TaxID=217634 RepID=UPI00087585DD|nr:uncharacterized protein LOC108906525 [Anoplophora glabripennis]
MSMTDKAVSTEDLCADSQKQGVLPGVARLEAILHTLVENKVEALKNDSRKASSVNSSPMSIFKRLKFTSGSNQRTKIEEAKPQKDEKGAKHKKREHHVVNVSQIKRQALKQEVSISSPESQQYQCRVRSCEVSLNSEEDRNRSINYDNIYIDNSCSSLSEKPRCCCNRDINRELMHFDDDYISLKIEGFGDVETDAIISEEALRRARRKRRRRRKRRMKKRLATHHAHLVDPVDVHDSYKNLTEDELSRRAKWTIVATACLLLFMCLLLVGITLRMAPIIDEMVRKENEEFVHSITRHRNFSTSVHKNVT